MRSFRNSTILTPILFIALSLSGRAQTHTWTGADPSGYWSAPANWSPAGVPLNGVDLVFPGGLPPGDMVSTNDLTDSIFRSIRFDQAGGHTVRGNPITLTNRSECIVNSGTNVIACDLTFSGTPPTPDFQSPTIRDSFGSGELTVIGNVGGGSVSFFRQQFGTQARWVIRGQFTGGSLRVGYSTLALFGDNPNAISAVVDHSTLLVQGSQPNLNIRMFSMPLKTLIWSSLGGEGQVGDVTGGASIVRLDSTLAVNNFSVTYLYIHLNGTNVGEYGRLVASGNVSASSGFLSASAGFNPKAGQVYTIVEKTSPGPVTSAFFGPEGTITNLNGRPFRLSYLGGDGNDVTLTAQPSNADPTFSNANWSPLGSGMNNVVYALAGSGNDLYAGGWFSTAGGSPAECIAKWDGTTWSALGSGVALGFDFKAVTTVYALAVSGGDLYAGGRFKTAGGSPATNIAKWNGSTWSPLGSGITGLSHPAVFALAVSGTDLYAGGVFRTAGGTPATNIAKWNGSSWSPLGSGMNNIVFALAVSGTDLYAGGAFTMAGGTPANSIAKWNGSSWSALGSGIGGTVRALAVSGSDLYAAGEFTTAGGSPANYIAKWNGSSWSPLGSGMNGNVGALAASSSGLYAGGQFTMAEGNPATNIAKWNGNSWSALGSGVSDGPQIVNVLPVSALALSRSDLYVGGRFTTAGGKASAYIAKARIASAAESISASGSSATIQFSAVVGYAYHVQRTTSLSAPITWTTLTTTPLLPASDGSLTFTDTNAPPGTAYYRLVQD